MRLQQTPQQPLNLKLNNQTQKNNGSDSSKIAFGTGEAVSVLNFLATNQAWGAAAVDLFSMVIPRTAVDFTRGPDAGIETARREFSSAINDALVGVYGMIAASALAIGLNNKFGVKAHKMFIGDDMLNILGQAWHDKKTPTNEKPLEEFLTHIVSQTKGFNPNAEGADTKGWVKIDEKSQKAIVAKLKEGINTLPEEMKDKSAKDAYKEFKAYTKALIMDSTGVESEFKLEKEMLNAKNQKETVKAVASVDDLIDNVFRASKAFMNDKISKEFKPGNISENGFIKSLKGLNKGTALFGLALSLVVGLSIQPLNVYLTKKKTGKTGFVGVEGKENDKSEGFNTMKFGVGALACLAALATITTKPSELLKKIQFKSLSPTIDQFKLVYGTTIVSRILSARDNNELRETATKDSLGFANWLLLGGFVSKFVAENFEKIAMFKNNGEKFLKHNANEHGKMPQIFTASVVSREEVLHTALKKAGISTIQNGKALTFKEMLAKVVEGAAKNADLKLAKSKLKYISLIQFSGYLYSGLVLGVGLPKFNIAMTKMAEKKRKAQEEAKKSAVAA